MLWTQFQHSAEAALETYADRRTDLGINKNSLQQVSSPSQKRYVKYLERIMYEGEDYSSTTLRLINRITVNTMPFHPRQCVPVTFIIESRGTVVYDHGKTHGIIRMRRDHASQQWHFDPGAVLVSGDVAIRFYYFEEDAKFSGEGAFLQAEFMPGAREIKCIPCTSLCFSEFSNSDKLLVDFQVGEPPDGNYSSFNIT